MGRITERIEYGSFQGIGQTRLNTPQELRQRQVEGERQYLKRTQAKFLLTALHIRYERTA
jgi:hypothetical protein